ncbi:hypothetical protein ACLB2K_035557 [Fragaria x ananassa]
MSTSSSSYGCYSVNSDSEPGCYKLSEEVKEIIPAETGDDLVVAEDENKEAEPEAPIVVEAPAATEYDRDLFTNQDGKKVKVGHEKRGLCVHCGADLKGDTSFNGTSTLRRHIQKVCKKYAGRESIDDGQAVIVGDGEAEPEMQL